MCGICGYRSNNPVNLEKMLQTMSHRGPDDSGVYRFRNVGLGHQRLAIIDLLTGHQPMESEDERYCIVFNGEIYNFLTLRKKLEEEGFLFHTNSDTEVLLKMFQSHGKNMLDFLNGDFALVIYDKMTDSLFGARDRLGVKPLYYCRNSHGFFFASEIKSLFESGFIKPRVSPASVDLYFTYRYVPGASTSFKDIFKVPPGFAFEQQGTQPAVFWRYWDIPTEENRLSFSDAIEGFDALLEDSVRLRLLSDVPLGSYLSGGVDSTVLTRLMAQLLQNPLRTYTVGFGLKTDEIEEASKTARFLHSQHHGLMVDPEAFAFLSKIIWHMDEPFGDQILIPAFLLSRLAGKKVKVILSGDGADEGQLGYIHHEAFSKISLANRVFPKFLYPSLEMIVNRLPVSLLDLAFKYPASMGTAGRERLSGLLSRLPDFGEACQWLTSLFTRPEKEALFGPLLRMSIPEADELFHRPMVRKIADASDPLREIYLHDLRHWLPDNILNKHDRMTMAHSVEGRVPYLDHRLIEFQAKLPLKYMINKGKGKRILSHLFQHKYAIPPWETKEKKAFFMPIEGAFHLPYKELINKWLSPSSIAPEIFNRWGVRELIAKAGESPLLGHKKVMAIALFQIWLDVFKPTWD